MRLIFISLCFTIFISAHIVNDKLILDYSKNKSKLKNKLFETEKFLIDNILNKKLIKSYELTTQIEKIKEFYVLTIKPIKSKKLKIDLEIFLNQKYPNMFFISNVKKKVVKQNIRKDTNLHKDKNPIFIVTEINKISFLEVINKIGLEWIALLFLSIVGLLYSLYNRKKSILIDKNQNKLKENQSDIEKEFNKMESRDE